MILNHRNISKLSVSLKFCRKIWMSQSEDIQCFEIDVVTLMNTDTIQCAKTFVGHIKTDKEGLLTLARIKNRLFYVYKLCRSAGRKRQKATEMFQHFSIAIERTSGTLCLRTDRQKNWSNYSNARLLANVTNILISLCTANSSSALHYNERTKRWIAYIEKTFQIFT